MTVNSNGERSRTRLTVVIVVAAVIAVMASVMAIALTQGSNNAVKDDVQQRQQQQHDTSASDRLRVMTTFYPLYEFTKAVAGDRAYVDLFIPAGLEPHDWEPSARDLERLKNYQLLIYNSRTFEPYIERVEELYDLKVVEAAEGIMVNNDPHVWLDPLLAKEQVKRIADALAGIDEANREYYMENARAYMSRLDELHARFEQGLSDCEIRRFITLHTAYHYIASRYGLEQITIAGLEPEHDVPASKIKEIIDTAREHGIRVVYAEEGIDDRIVRALAEEIDASVLTISPIEVLDEDDLKEGKTYIAKMEENLENLRVGLGCR